MIEMLRQKGTTIGSRREMFVDCLRGRLIVSCQDYVGVMIDAALQGGASALRVNTPQSVRVARAKTDVPIIACNKVYFPNCEIYITPSIRIALKLVEAGADAVALDCTSRCRCRQSVGEIVKAIHDANALAVGDIHSLDEGKTAADAGADILATTLADRFDPDLITSLSRLGKPVLAEGHIDTPQKARQAVDAGAWAVCVGSAITRPHLMTEAFTEALGE
jgi:N-acylglucosamine-6-phosphate 2-epimerase